MSEVSGRDDFEVGLMLEGEPQDAAGKLERAKKKYDFERGSGAGIFGNAFTDMFSTGSRSAGRASPGRSRKPLPGLKCVLLCANCHAEVEGGVTALPLRLSRIPG